MSNYVLDTHTHTIASGHSYSTMREMIEEGATAEEIKARWQPDVEAFKELRKPYLLYAE